jgi:pimeloyl-ACP methyl ester carboxylesterase
MAEGMARGHLRTTDSFVVARVVNSYTSARPNIAVPVLMNLFPKAAEAKHKLLQLPFPLQLIMCTYSPYDSAALKKYCRMGYRVVTIDGSGHFPMLEQPVVFNEALRQLLQTH